MAILWGNSNSVGVKTGWLAGIGMALTALVPVSAFAADSPPAQPSALLANGTVTIGVSGDASIAGVGLGPTYLPDTSGLNWGLITSPTLVAPPLNVDGFTANGVGAVSSVSVDDSAGGLLRVTHDFHPAAATADLYEVTVSVENVGTTVVEARYERVLNWSTDPASVTAATVPNGWSVAPAPDGHGEVLNLDLPPMDPGSSQVFRLYLGGAGDTAQAQSALGTEGASLVTSTPLDSSTLVFGYAPGATPTTAGTGSGGGSRGSSGGGGGGGGAGPGGSGARGGGGGASGGGGVSPGGVAAPIAGGPVSDLPSGSVGGLSSIGGPTDGSGSGPGGHSNTPSDPPTIVSTDGVPGGGCSGDCGGQKPAPCVPLTLNCVIGSGKGGDTATVGVGDTPELGSLALLASGLVTGGGYALIRWRSRRRRPTED
jgi:hypothetical protein